MNMHATRRPLTIWTITRVRASAIRAPRKHRHTHAEQRFVRACACACHLTKPGRARHARTYRRGRTSPGSLPRPRRRPPAPRRRRVIRGVYCMQQQLSQAPLSAAASHFGAMWEA